MPAVVEAWAGMMQGGREPRRAGRLARLDPGDWISVAQDGQGTLSMDEVERALVSGAPCLIAAVDPTWVPPAVAALADIEANIEPLDWRILRYVAARAAGLPSSRGLAEPGKAVLAQITPRLLRLAYRSRGGAEGLLRRALAAAEASRPPSPPQPEQSGPRGLARVPGICPALGWGQHLVADLRAFRAGKLAWRDVDRGALLAGPPGTGKTTFARALAEEAGVRLVATSFAEWQSAKDGHLGSTLAAMQLAFSKARMVTPCILFIDELDSLPDRSRVQSGHGDYWRSVVNGFLAEVDGAVAREGVVIISACNDAHVVEPAVLRSGRLAVHEAGHAVATEAVRPGTLVEVTLRPYGASGGRTLANNVSDEELTPPALRLHLVALLAGRAAEEAILGDAGAGYGLGSGSDLAQATRSLPWLCQPLALKKKLA